jgi:hypothetical protein
LNSGCLLAIFPMLNSLNHILRNSGQALSSGFQILLHALKLPFRESKLCHKSRYPSGELRFGLGDYYLPNYLLFQFSLNALPKPKQFETFGLLLPNPTTTKPSQAHPFPNPALPSPPAAPPTILLFATVVSPTQEPDYRGYYLGLRHGVRGKPRLLARSSNIPWTMPFSGDHAWPSTHKRSFIVRNHPLKAKLDAGIRREIDNILASMRPDRWISVDYLRLGYEVEEEGNPAVVLLSVEVGEVGKDEAKRVVDEIDGECVRQVFYIFACRSEVNGCD